jgi:hypothetical protein
MRLAFGRNGESAIGSGENGGGRELGNGDVIRMPVRTVGSKREDDIPDEFVLLPARCVRSRERDSLRRDAGPGSRGVSPRTRRGSTPPRVVLPHELSRGRLARDAQARHERGRGSDRRRRVWPSAKIPQRLRARILPVSRPPRAIHRRDEQGWPSIFAEAFPVNHRRENATS